MSQAELLTVYGADPGSPDSNGKTPIDYARLAVLVKLELMEPPASHRGSMCVSLQGSWPPRAGREAGGNSV